jgi:hypothetical protein
LPGKTVSLPPERSSVLVAGGAEKRPVVRHDQTAALAIAAQEMLEQDLRPQVEEVRRLVEEEERSARAGAARRA